MGDSSTNMLNSILTTEVLEGLSRETELARGLPNAAFTSDAVPSA